MSQNERQPDDSLVPLVRAEEARLAKSLAQTQAKAVQQKHQGTPAFWEAYKHWSREDDHTVGTAVRALHVEVRSFRRRQRNLDDDLRVLSAYEEVVTALAPAVDPEAADANLEYGGLGSSGGSEGSAKTANRSLRSGCQHASSKTLRRRGLTACASV
ncbi:hypothetical protein ACFL6U_18215 [Planctomycetota bacterium]